MKTWQLQEAKARFSEVVDQALANGPQEVTRRGKPAVLVISLEDYDKARQSEPKPKRTLVEQLQACPSPELADVLDSIRDKDTGREIRFD